MATAGADGGRTPVSSEPPQPPGKDAPVGALEVKDHRATPHYASRVMVGDIPSTTIPSTSKPWGHTDLAHAAAVLALQVEKTAACTYCSPRPIGLPQPPSKPVTPGPDRTQKKSPGNFHLRVAKPFLPPARLSPHAPPLPRHIAGDPPGLLWNR